MVKKFKVDIFKTLAAIDKCDREYYNNLDEEGKKALAMVVAMRWASAVERDEPQYPIITNIAANEGFHSLYKHPQLQWLCLTLIGDGKTRRHKWIKPSKKTNIKSKQLFNLLRKNHPLASVNELEMLDGLMSLDDVKDLAEKFGMQDDEIKKLVKEVKASGKK